MVLCILKKEIMVKANWILQNKFNLSQSMPMYAVKSDQVQIRQDKITKFTVAYYNMYKLNSNNFILFNLVSLS